MLMEKGSAEVNLSIQEIKMDDDKNESRPEILGLK